MIHSFLDARNSKDRSPRSAEWKKPDTWHKTKWLHMSKSSTVKSNVGKEIRTLVEGVGLEGLRLIANGSLREVLRVVDIWKWSHH